MAASTVSSTVEKMKPENNTTLDWDLVVNYSESEINKLIQHASEEAQKAGNAKKFIEQMSCELKGNDDDSDTGTYTISYTFDIAFPSIMFRATNAGARCALTMAVTGGTVVKKEYETKDGVTKLVKKIESKITKDTYEMKIDNLHLGTARVEDTTTDSYKAIDKQFYFHKDKDDKAAVIINLGASDSPRIYVKHLEGTEVKLIHNHLADVQGHLESALKDHKDVRYELAHISSDRPPTDGDNDYIQLKIKSFQVAVHTENLSDADETAANKHAVLSLFINTSDDSPNRKNETMATNWTALWRNKLKCSPIPEKHTASIIFSKSLVYSVMKQTLQKQGYTASLENENKKISLSINTKKSVSRKEMKETTRQPFRGWETRTVTEIKATLPDLKMECYENASAKGEYKGSWSFSYGFDWTYSLYDPSLGLGSSSKSKHGHVTATHSLKDTLTKPAAVVDDYKLALDYPIASGDWEVTFKGDDTDFWNEMCGGQQAVPKWAKDLSVELPAFTLHLGNLYFFLVTNCAFPNQKVVKVDTESGIHFPNDMYLVGSVVHQPK